MGVHRTAAKRDKNERDIITAYKGIGATVVQLSIKGVCDLLVGFRGVNYLVEVKEGKNNLTPDQIAFFDSWAGQRVVVWTVDEALEAIGAITVEI